jgi:hypothetical protein
VNISPRNALRVVLILTLVGAGVVHAMAIGCLILEALRSDGWPRWMAALVVTGETLVLIVPFSATCAGLLVWWDRRDGGSA